VTLVKIPGAVFFLPDEAPQQTAEVIASAVTQATCRLGRLDDLQEGGRGLATGSGNPEWSARLGKSAPLSRRNDAAR
jgi:hypothetical protein